MNWREAELVSFIREAYSRLADPNKAGPMAAYMKTTMPFYGIQKPERTPVYREMKKRFVPTSREQYAKAVQALWSLPHREEKYAAIEYAKQHKTFIDAHSIPLYRELIEDGAWWDFVDDIAINLVGHAYLAERAPIKPIIETWSTDPDLWIRRSALISHNHHRAQTDSEQLFRHCLLMCGEKEFFIRKAIGWALREYSYANPEAVGDFLTANRSKLSPLSFNEGAKRLSKAGLLATR